MAYEIYIGNYAGTKVLQLPIIPEEMPSLSNNISNEEFQTFWDLPYNFIEKKGLMTFELTSWLPVDVSKYNFCKSKVNAKDIIDLIENAIDNTEPLKIVINAKSGYYVNDTFAVEKFEYKIKKDGNYSYSLGVKQWRNYNTTITQNQNSSNAGWKQDSTGWWYVYNITDNYYYVDSWQLINNEWYSFDTQGYARQSKWLKDGGKWYWLKDDCAMARGQWLQLENKWYYFGSDGAMYSSGTYTIDGKSYAFDDNGAWIES